MLKELESLNITKALSHDKTKKLEIKPTQNHHHPNITL